ncbi:multidrug resistance protein NorM [Algimonas arctica]|uniref:Multidrug-efflux transporter n=1 Tax=Algimonas arctica TaxID=1479486 RepID=A0A8J3G3G9_9PROT|nr:MATE family efflux transporter [Algimonas arctica]GHB03644.1 multidrug resistance protein NorM [Algimonas arctica]
MSDQPLINPSMTVMPRTKRGELRALLALGLPMSLTQVIQYSVFVADTMMIGRIGKEAVAAAALGSLLVFLVWMVAAGPVNAVTPMASQALGRDRNSHQDVRRSVRMALWAVALLCIPLFMLIGFTEPILLALGQDADVAKMAAHYAWVVAPGLPLSLAVMVLRNFLATIDETLQPLIAVTLAVLLNIGLNAVLIFGLFGFPALGLIGAGIASSISYAVCFLIFVVMIQRHERAREFDVFQNVLKFDRERFVEVVRLSVPISLTTLFEGLLFNVAIILMGWIGVAEQAAYHVGLNVAAMAFMVPWGFAMGGAVRVGLAEGAGDAQARKRSAYMTLGVSMGLTAVIALFVATQGGFIADLYFGFDSKENDAPVRALVLTFLPVAAGFMVVDAAQVTCNQLLRGLKDVNWPMVITGVSYWLIGFPLCYGLTFQTSMGAIGVWWGLAVGLFVAFIGLGIRLLLLLRRPLVPATA